ncbi:MAG TPA: DUF4342 domain-containing protein [Candidatus Dormibacteraeota bacterium]
MPTQTQEQTRTEQFKIDPDRLLAEIRRLINEGNVRRISIKQGEHTIVELPLTVGVAGAVLAPWLAAVGAIAALVTDCNIVVERVEPAG